MRTLAACYDNLRDSLETIPIIDCHDHTSVVGPRYADPIQVIATQYCAGDLHSASGDAEAVFIQNSAIPLEERWPVLEKAWRRTCHTGYARVTRMVLDRFYGVKELSLDALRSMEGRLIDFSDEKAFEALLDEARIKVRLTNPLAESAAEPSCLMTGALKMPPKALLAIPLPMFSVSSNEGIEQVCSIVERTATTLDEYVDVCRSIFEKLKSRGAPAFKSQCAYWRSLEFVRGERKEAEALFGRLASSPGAAIAGMDEIRPLDDYLFHEFMRMAGEMDMPVQIHTGELAGVRNDIRRADALWLIPLLNQHPDVRFDLFHVNWPHGDSILFLGKNYPNVSIDFCWTHIIDPVFCQNILKQVLSSVPHGKIHGYGSDFVGCPDRVWAHASIARDNIAIALADMVEMGYLGLDEARQVASEWLYENPREFYRLGTT